MALQALRMNPSYHPNSGWWDRHSGLEDPHAVTANCNGQLDALV